MNDAPVIIYIFIHYPLLSQTFLRREVAGLIDQGFTVEIYSLVRPGAAQRRHALPGVPVNYFRWWEPVKLLVALPRELARDRALLRDGWRWVRQPRWTSLANLAATLWAAAFAVCRAQAIRRRRPQLVHGVWATGPATAAAVLSRLCGVPFSFGAQAHDLYRHGGDALLAPKLRAASLVHTTTEINRAHLRQRAGPHPVNLVLARRGLESLPANVARVRESRPVRLLSVGRLVPKKGHALQLAACRQLRDWGVPFEARIIGAGPLHGSLHRQIARAGLGECVRLCGALAPNQVADQYWWADIFWHTGVVDDRGDRDGLPNVIPEAMAHSLPVICGQTPGATEAVTHEQTGLVVDAGDAAALAGAVKRLAEDFDLRRQLGENSRRWVGENFMIATNTKILADAFRQVIR